MDALTIFTEDTVCPICGRAFADGEPVQVILTTTTIKVTEDDKFVENYDAVPGQVAASIDWTDNIMIHKECWQSKIAHLLRHS